jgi:hypothetical protein
VVHFGLKGPINLIGWDGSVGRTLVENGMTPAYRKGFETNHLQIIAKGSRIAVYVNGELLWLVEDDVLRKGVFRLRGRNGRVEFDNFKVWDIANLPNTP